MEDDLVKACDTEKITVLFSENPDLVSNIYIIADDIMIDGYKPDHSDHDQAFTALLQPAQKHNVQLNYDKLQ